MHSLAQKFHIIILGSAGTIYRQAAKVIEHLGVLHTSLTPLLQSLHIHAVHCAHSIVIHRRRLERTPSEFYSSSKDPTTTTAPGTTRTRTRAGMGGGNTGIGGAAISGFSGGGHHAGAFSPSQTIPRDISLNYSRQCSERNIDPCVNARLHCDPRLRPLISLNLLS